MIDDCTHLLQWRIKTIKISEQRSLSWTLAAVATCPRRLVTIVFGRPINILLLLLLLLLRHLYCTHRTLNHPVVMTTRIVLVTSFLVVMAASVTSQCDHFPNATKTRSLDLSPYLQPGESVGLIFGVGGFALLVSILFIVVRSLKTCILYFSLELINFFSLFLVQHSVTSS